MKILKLFFLLFTITFVSKAQMATVDVAANVQTKISNTLNNIISGLNKVQANVNNDALAEAIKTSGTVTKQFELINQVYSISSNITGLRKVREFFSETSEMTVTVSSINRYLANDKFKTLSTSQKEQIKGSLDESINNMKVAVETMQFALNPVNKLSVSERLKEFDNASQSLLRATEILDVSRSIIYQAAVKTERKIKSDHYSMLKYGIR